MLTAGDKKWFEEKFKVVRDTLDLQRSKLTSLSLERHDLNSRFDSIEAASVRTEEKIDKLLNILDRQSGRLDTLEQENKMGAVTTSRHGRHLQVLSKKVGVKLEL